MLFPSTVLLALTGVLGCAAMGGTPAGGRGSAVEPGIGQPLPSVAMGAFDGGGQVSIERLRGKVVLLDIWASWCVPCKEELPMLDDMAARLKGDGVEFVAVSIDEDKDAARAFLKTRPKWHLTFAHDPDGRVPEKLQPSKMPTSYIIDRSGVLRQVNAGFERADIAKIEAKLRELAASR